MSFSRDVKEELLQDFPDRRCCRKTLLAAMSWLSGPGGSTIRFSDAAVGRFAVLLLKRMSIERWGMGISARGRGHAGKLILGDPVSFSPSPRTLPACCRRVFFKAAFLSKGYVAPPKRSYHVELRAAEKAQADAINALWKVEGLLGGVYARRKEWVAFLKGGEQVGRFLNLIGGQQSVLRFEEIRALKETKNMVRRRVNYESANLTRMVQASGRQRRFFLSLMEHPKRWRALPAALRDAAEGRIKYPRLNLEELARKLGMSKSALNHRFRRLEAMAEATPRKESRPAF